MSVRKIRKRSPQKIRPSPTKRTEKQLPKMQKIPMAMHTPTKVLLFTVVEVQKRRPAHAIRQTVQTLSRVPGEKWSDQLE